MTDVAIVGAGFSGTLLSWHLTRAGIDCTLIGDARTFGLGRAYSTHHEEHLLNVPHVGMSAFPDQPDHFRAWLEASGYATDKSSFVPRMVYGRYLKEICATSGARRIADWVTSATPSADGWSLDLQATGTLVAKNMVLATGHRLPRLPAMLEGLGDRVITDPYEPGVLEGIERDASLLVIGTGLTAVDVLATLQARRHAGPILALSRNGRWPARHNLLGGRHAAQKRPQPTATGYLAWLRREIAQAQESGRDWRRVFDAIRPEIQRLWQGLPVLEQARLMRHARNVWDASRHQVPAPSNARIEQLRAKGQLRSHGARLTAVARRGNRCSASYRTRTRQTHTVDFDLAILCTGTDNAPRPQGGHLVDRLFDAGSISVDAHRIGILTDADGRCLVETSRVVPNLYAMGPLRRGTLWENIAVPELRNEAKTLADYLAGQVDIGPLHPRGSETDRFTGA